MSIQSIERRDTAFHGLPPLEQGDRLTRDEFERRYANMASDGKAELIEGVVNMQAAVRFGQHGSPHASLVGWLFLYQSQTPGTLVGDNATIRLDLDNEPQPDAALIIDPSYGGRVRISDDDYVEGAPELVAEIAASSVSIDMNQKKNVYRRNQVIEYVVWRVQDRELDWFVLRGGDYVPLEVSGDGVLRSETFPGLWLDANSLLSGDMNKVVEASQRGTASQEHARFVRLLKERPGGS
ncbi:MAG: Uma2 family endonuclease [Planctomycetaceae bacterium]